MKLINAIQQSDKPLIYHKPDSCLVRNNEAFFLPEFAQTYIARLAYVIRIKKIGKNLQPRFAERYYDEVSVGLNIEAKDKLRQLRSEGLPWDEAVCFDYSAPIGTFVEKQNESLIELLVNNKPLQHLNTSQLDIDNVIAEISHRYTLKIGDLVYISLATEDYQLKIEDELTLQLDGKLLLHCAIK